MSSPPDAEWRYQAVAKITDDHGTITRSRTDTVNGYTFGDTRLTDL